MDCIHMTITLRRWGLEGTSKWLFNTMLDLLGRYWFQRSVVKGVLIKKRTSNDVIGLLSVTAYFLGNLS